MHRFEDKREFMEYERMRRGMMMDSDSDEHHHFKRMMFEDDMRHSNHNFKLLSEDKKPKEIPWCAKIQVFDQKGNQVEMLEEEIMHGLI